ncbi:hypothetical protein HY061_03085 [Candidatus Azambacteria bacterium]|nr:hypothetical protein [Candidatus Azambacteria bacterium]
MNSNLNIKYQNYFKIIVSGFLLLAVVVFFTVIVFVKNTNATEIPPELVLLAQDLNCNSKEACEIAFGADLGQGIKLAEKHNLYDKETKKLAQTFKTEVLSKLTSIASENFDEEFVKIAKTMISKKPALSRLLNLDKQEVAAAEVIITQIKEEGVSLKICSQPAESLTREQLVACLKASNKLTENKPIVRSYISKERFDLMDKNKSMTSLKEALDRGEYSQLGAKNPDELGKICLRSGSPVQCDEIAAKFFGANGPKYLARARQQVSSVAQKYLNQADNFVLTMPDGQTIAGEDGIRDFCDEAFNSHNLDLAKRCGEFAVKNGFISEEEEKEGIDFLESIEEKDFNFSECRKNPRSCERFIPQGQREQFNVGQQIESIITSETGFSPIRCRQGEFDHEIALKCFNGSKKALPKLEALAEKSPQAQQIVNDIKRKIGEGERYMNKSQEIQKTFQDQGGPGGCKSPQECFTYCSDSVHGLECISFGAKHKIFEKEEAIDRFQKYNDQIDNEPLFFDENENRNEEKRSLPEAEFQPSGRDIISPTQRFNLPPPRPGFILPSGSDQLSPNSHNPKGVGLNPGCLNAIRTGDFLKAKESCRIPEGKLPIDKITPHKTICPKMPTVNECQEGQSKIVTFSSPECGTYYRCQSSDRTTTNKTICPKMPTVNECPEGQSKIVTFSSPECGTYYHCQSSDRTTTNITCPSDQHWDGVKCSLYDYYKGDPITACEQSGGTWENNYCKMPGGTSPTTCSSGQYWDGSACVNNTSTPPPSSSTTNDPATMCAQSGGAWTGSTCNF